MHSLLVAASFAPRLTGPAAGVEGVTGTDACGRGATTYLPAEPLNSSCTDSKHPLAIGRGLARLA
jgi:hypothetical protein